MDVTFTLNGDNAPFNFSNEKLASTVRLNKGKNIVSIRARNSVGSDEESVIIYLNTPDGSFPPPPPPQPVPTPTTYPPVISWVRPSNNPETTTFSTFEVKARINNVERKKDVRFYINGYESNDFDFNPNSGDFKANARLRDGDNNLTLSAINKGGNDQKETRIILQVPTPERVDVAITQPQSNPYQTQQNSITIEANIRGVNDKRDLEVRINGKGLSNFNFDKSRGKLTASVSLDKGENHVIVKANGRSSSDSDERVINYQTNVQPPPPPPPAENNKPKVTILQPNSGDVANQKSTLVRATVTNVNNKNDITLTVNNVKVFNYEYSTKDHLLIATVDLNDGNNTISVRAQNSYGSDEESVNVKVLAKINIPKAPKVKISAPINGINLTNANTIVKASVSNVTDKSKISFKLNNNDINDFAFSNGEIQASITLREGSNNINIKATNADGSDDDAVVVNYTKQVAAPTVTITSPNDNVKAKTNSIKVTANVKNAVQRDVSCFVNGKVITGFTMVAEQVAFDATLVPGKNIILVKVQNVSGKAEDQVNVMFAEIPNATKPTVQFIDPAEIGKTVSSNVYKVKAKVTGVTSNNEITIKLNNNKISNFNFNERNGEVTFDANLNIGKNVISIDVKTKGGVDVANTTINYENKGLPTLAKPEIVTLTATQPVGNPMNPTAPAVSTVTATLKNISDKKEISLSVNGKKTDEFTFANRSGILTANVQLRSGENIIKLTVTNNAGSATKTTTINY
ncbi:MAG: hypothetical protein KA010_03920, partial [Saprospiraceae bacterium]|nr:hypothetical protein [Saprospiraceae bacterium]